MKKFLKFYKSRIAALFLLVFFSACFFDNKPEILSDNELHQIIFHHHLDPITDKYELPKLRDFSLYGNDLEIRVWVDARGKDGFILRRFNRQWSAIAIKGIDCNRFSNSKKDGKYSVGKINLPEPESGWQNAWKRLSEAEILDLPDYSQAPKRNDVIDGSGYIVEINKDGKYRLYIYPNPQIYKSKEEEKMMKIGEIISEEFNLHNFESGSLCIEK